MKFDTNKRESGTAKASPRMPKLWEALAAFGALIVILTVSLVHFRVTAHVPMVFGVAIVSLMALRFGHPFKDIEKGMMEGVIAALPAVIILVVVGALIGVWILGGIVPTMIYYGLGIINPRFFLVTVLLICSITSLATGTSWGTAGTLGIAFMGIAAAIDVPLPMAAGAVVSGSYFGDKLSPLSDTTLMTSGIAGTDVIAHIKHMLRNTIIAFILAAIVFTIMGLQFDVEADYAAIYEITSTLHANFTITPWLLLPPILVIVTIALKLPVLAGIFIGLLAGIIFAVATQTGVNLGDAMRVGYAGFVSETGIEAVDRLLSRGGMQGVTYAILLILPAMSFAGILQKTKMIDVVVERVLMRFVKGPGSLVGTVAFSCVFTNVTMADQYVANILPTKMFAGAFRERQLHPKMLSATTDSVGTLTSALVPWNTCGAFMMGVLGVSPFAFAPFAIFNWMVPITFIILTGIGILVVKVEKDPGSLTQETLEEYRKTASEQGLEVSY